MKKYRVFSANYNRGWHQTDILIEASTEEEALQALLYKCPIEGKFEKRGNELFSRTWASAKEVREES